MAQYTVQAPDGKTITLEGPDGASHEDVIAQAQKLYQPAAPVEKPSLVSDALKYSPVGVVKSLADAIRDPKHALSELLAQPSENAKLLQKAKDSYHAGDYTGAAAHFLNYLIPGGGALDDAGEDFASGDPVRGALKTAGLASTVVAGAKAPAALEAATEPSKASSGAPAIAKTAARRMAVKLSTKMAGDSTGVGARVINSILDALKDGETDAPAPRPSNIAIPALRDRPPLRVPDTTAPPAPDATPIPADSLPSGRVPGGAQNQPPQATPLPPRVPFRVEISEPEPLPDASPIRGNLPSGRTPGGIQNQTAAEPAAAAAKPDMEILNAISQSQAGKPFAKLTPQGQATVKMLAAHVVEDAPAAPALIQRPAPGAPMTKSALAKRALADEMLKSGSATPEMLADPADLPDPHAVADMMRELPAGAPKAIAKANYAGNQEPQQAGIVYDAAGRAAKSQNLATMLYDEGAASKDIANWDLKKLNAEAKMRGMDKPFSMKSFGELVQQLRKMESESTSSFSPSNEVPKPEVQSERAVSPVEPTPPAAPSIHAAEVSFDNAKTVNGKKEIRVYSQDEEGNGMHITKDGVQRMVSIVGDRNGTYQVIAKPVSSPKTGTETVGGAYSLQQAKQVAEAYAKGEPHPFAAVENGVPISEYAPKNKPIKFEESRYADGLHHQNINGSEVWTDGRVAFADKPPGPLSTSPQQPNIARVWEDAAKDAQPARPIGSFLENSHTRIVLDNGTLIDGQYYDWANKKYPGAEFRVGRRVDDAVSVWKDGKQVGVISPLRKGVELPKGIRDLMGNKK